MDDINRLTGRIIALAYRVQEALGPGLSEAVYANALTAALRKDSLDVEREASIPVLYEGEEVGRIRADLVVEGWVVVETKVASSVTDAHLDQLRKYLDWGGYEAGLLIAFGGREPEVRRINKNRREK